MSTDQQGGLQADEQARGDLAEAMVQEAAGLAIAVREEPREEIARRLAGLDRVEMEALAVVLAAMVDPDQLLHESLAWVTFDEHGNAASPYVPRYRRTAREKAALRPDRSAPYVRRSSGLERAPDRVQVA